MSLPVTKADVDQLVQALNRLSIALERASLPTAAASSSPPLSYS